MPKPAAVAAKTEIWAFSVQLSAVTEMLIPVVPGPEAFHIQKLSLISSWFASTFFFLTYLISHSLLWFMLLAYSSINCWRLVPEKTVSSLSLCLEDKNSCTYWNCQQLIESSVGVRITSSQQLLKHSPHVY